MESDQHNSNEKFLLTALRCFIRQEVKRVCAIEGIPQSIVKDQDLIPPHVGRFGCTVEGFVPVFYKTLYDLACISCYEQDFINLFNGSGARIRVRWNKKTNFLVRLFEKVQARKILPETINIYSLLHGQFLDQYGNVPDMSVLKNSKVTNKVDLFIDNLINEIIKKLLPEEKSK